MRQAGQPSFLLEQSGEVDPVGSLQHFIPEIENLLDMLVDFIASCTAIVDDAFFQTADRAWKAFLFGTPVQ